MRLRLTRGAFSSLAVLLAIGGAASAQPSPPSPIGRWLTEKHDGVIEIAACGASLCGHIVGMDRPLGPDGKPARDVAGEPKCGLLILRQVEPRGADSWHADITDPDTGKVWNCDFTIAADGTLHLRGYVVVRLLGETQIWTRYQGRLGTDCGMG